MSTFETPFPVEGTVTPHEDGHRAKLPCESEWLTETEHGNILQAAVDRAARKYGEGTEVRVRFTADRTGEQCGDYELLGPVQDVDGGGGGGQDIHENPEGLPDHHPLAGFDKSLDDHAAHLDALGEYFSDVDPEEVGAVMAIITTSEATDTIPTARADADIGECIWFQLAAHVSHVAQTFDAKPEAVAEHACHVLRDQYPQDGGSA